MNEGYRIHTTIDAELQNMAEASLNAHLDEVEKNPGYSHQTYADYAATFKKGAAGCAGASRAGISAGCGNRP